MIYTTKRFSEKRKEMTKGAVGFGTAGAISGALIGAHDEKVAFNNLMKAIGEKESKSLLKHLKSKSSRNRALKIGALSAGLGALCGMDVADNKK